MALPEKCLSIDEDAISLLVKAGIIVETQVNLIASLYYHDNIVEMAASGSQSFVRGRGRQSARNGGEDCDREIFRLKDVDYDKIMSYLEIPDHFLAVTGGGRKTTIERKYWTKVVVFKTMLAAIQHHGFPSQVTAGNLQKRFQRYVKRYKDALHLKMDIGGGLTAEEREEGITIEDKLNRLCPHFERMHALYGEKHNVSPPVLADVGVLDGDLIPLETQNGELGTDSDEEISPHEQPTTPMEILKGNTPAGARQPPTPSTLKQANTMDKTFWEHLEGVGTEKNPQVNGMPQHDPDCCCIDCRNFVEISGETVPPPTELPTQLPERPPLHNLSTNEQSQAAPKKASKKNHVQGQGYLGKQ